MVITATDLALRASEQEALALLGLTDSNDTELEVAGSLNTLYGTEQIAQLANALDCYGTYSQRDQACKGCMASSLCMTQKESLKAQRLAERKAKQAEDLKYERFNMTASQVSRIPKYVREAERHLSHAEREWVCKLTDREIKEGDEIVLVSGYGICLADVIEIL